VIFFLSAPLRQLNHSLQIPDHYKVGLKNKERCAHVAAERTDEKIAERAAEVARNPSWKGLPWTAAELQRNLHPAHTRFGEIIKKHIVSHRCCFVFCCCTVLLHGAHYVSLSPRLTRDSRSGAAKARRRSGRGLPPAPRKGAVEPLSGETKSRFVAGPTCTPWASRCVLFVHISRCARIAVLTRKQVEEIASNNFAYNMRMMETSLHRAFHDNPARLWNARGAGSYFLSDEAIEKQQVNFICSSFFLLMLT
jgi:hypothetical protein